MKDEKTIIDYKNLSPRNKNINDLINEMYYGYTFGSERNDAEKKHPCLVPYNQLAEEEKVYDRNTNIETLKFIVCNGYKIIRS